MRKYTILSLIISVAISSSPLLAAKENIILEPSSKWVMDYAEESCKLSRTFGKGDKSLILNISRFSPSDTFELLLVSKYFKRASSNKPVSIKFGSQFDEQELSFKNGDTILSNKKKVSTLIINNSVRIKPFTEQEIETAILPISSKDEDTVDSIAIKAHRADNIILQTKTMKGAFAALRKCTESLVTSWGFDVEEQKNRARRAIPVNNPGKWIKSGDYPRQQLQNGEIAIIQFRLDVDESGGATNCVIQRSIGDEAFDRAVCHNIMKRAKFQPALDKNNKPIKSYWVNKVRFAFNQ